MTSRSSDWAQHFSGTDGSPVHQLDLLPSWDSEPQFGKDILTQKLWQIFAGTHDKVDQLRHRLTGRGQTWKARTEDHATLEQSPALKMHGFQEGSTGPGRAPGRCSPAWPRSLLESLYPSEAHLLGPQRLQRHVEKGEYLALAIQEVVCPTQNGVMDAKT